MSSSTSVLTGQVKWFNSKTGYGFITIVNGDKKNTDVLCHNTHTHVQKQCQTVVAAARNAIIT